MKRPENRNGRSESGPPEPWRRRAFSYAYVLRAINEPDQIYIGSTDDLRKWLKNTTGGCLRTPRDIGHGRSFGMLASRARKQRVRSSAI